LNRVNDSELGKGVVLLEIGGNDVLGSTSTDEYERNLDALLHCVTGSGRHVVMFELPIPPLANGYGRAQRNLAAKHNVVLIPKRVLMGVLTDEGATVDSLHLSPSGHQQMAESVWCIIGPALSK